MLKDAVLHEISTTFSVANFMSFGPDKLVRFSSIEFFEGEEFPLGLAIFSFINEIGECKPHMSYNIRTFKESDVQGNPFIRGLSTYQEILEHINDLTDQGYYCILHEAIPVDDGGISSGVYQNGVVAFSPGGTPRDMELDPQLATLSKDSHITRTILQLFDSQDIFDLFEDGYRYEFSLHCTGVGTKSQTLIVWERTPVDSELKLKEIQIWPSALSRYLGDKLYGNEVARDLELNTLPCSWIVNSSVSGMWDFNYHLFQHTFDYSVSDFKPVTINGATYTKPAIVRPCPAEQLPGKVDSILVDLDEFPKLKDYLTNEMQKFLAQTQVDHARPYDIPPEVSEIPLRKLNTFFTTEWVDELNDNGIETIMIQQFIDASYSGGWLVSNDGSVLVEGVPGHGMDFMVGDDDPIALPEEVTSLVISEVSKIPFQSRGEWVLSKDDGKLYVVQLHMYKDDTTQDENSNVIHISGNPRTAETMFKEWSPEEGLEALRNLVKSVSEKEGIRVSRYIGLTTHAADILRKHNVTAYMPRG